MLSLDDVLNKVTFGSPTMIVNTYYKNSLSMGRTTQTKTYSGAGTAVEEKLWLASLYVYYDITSQKTIVNHESTKQRFTDSLAKNVISDMASVTGPKTMGLLYWCQRYLSQYYLNHRWDMVEPLIGIYQYCAEPIASGILSSLEMAPMSAITLQADKKAVFLMMMNAFKAKYSVKYSLTDETNPYATTRRRRRRRRW